jgi:DNA-binding transcriptional MerR regulator
MQVALFLIKQEVSKVNGYRLYSAMQILLMLKIIRLRDMGFTIDEISSILDSYKDVENLKIFPLAL